MRTTLTLDDDVAALVRREVGKGRRRLRAVVNDALRQALAAPVGPRREAAPRAYTKPFHGGRFQVSIDNVAEALALAEGAAHR